MKQICRSLCVVIVLIAACGGIDASARYDAPHGLRTDLLKNTGLVWLDGFRQAMPLDSVSDQSDFHFAEIKSLRPLLSWEMPGLAGKGGLQKAYRIILSDNSGDAAVFRGNVWDSGITFSDKTSVLYGAGKPLQPGTTYYWRVKTISVDGSESGWSDVSIFRTGASVRDEFAVSCHPVEKQRQCAAEQHLRGDSILFIDFGKDAFSRLILTVDSDRNDTLTVHLGERLDHGRILRDPGMSTVRYRCSRLALKPGQHTYEVEIQKDSRNTGPDAILMPSYIGEVLPFRYCEIELPLSPGIIVKNAARDAVSYPFDETASSFMCSDDTLNMVWDLCKYSIKATSFAGIYVDGDRERIPYEADALINQLCHYGVDSSYGMARRTFEHLMEHPTWPTEWILQTVMIAWEDYMYTGDDRLLRKYYRRLRNSLLLPLLTDEGLISTTLSVQTPEFLSSINRKEPLKDIVDWPRTHKGEKAWDVPGESDGFEFTDYNTVVNAYHYRALQLMSEIAAVIGDRSGREEYSHMASKFKERFIRAFYDSENGRFADGVLSDTHNASLHSNMFPLAFGMTDGMNDDRPGRFIRSRGMACSVYGSQFLMEAVYGLGDADYALRLMTDAGDRGWFNMLRTGSTITTEAWDDKYKTNQDWNHAWGAAPANIIPRFLLGVTPSTPGFGTACIKPQTGRLKWAKGTIPTIKGAVRMEIDNDDRHYCMTVSIPSGMTADLYLPIVCANGKVMLDGTLVETHVSDGKFIYLGQVLPGTHRCEVEY